MRLARPVVAPLELAVDPSVRWHLALAGPDETAPGPSDAAEAVVGPVADRLNRGAYGALEAD